MNKENKIELNGIGHALGYVQSKLHVEKTRAVKNKSGRVMYKYRNMEDVLNALKKILVDIDASVTCTDELVLIGDRYYVKATSTMYYNKEEISAVAYAREPKVSGNMSDSQITGSASSYARKYSLNALFAIDDAVDMDSQESRDDEQERKDNHSQIMVTIKALVNKGVAPEKILSHLGISHTSEVANMRTEQMNQVKMKLAQL